MSGRPRAVAGLEGLLPRALRWRFDVRPEGQKVGWKITEAARERLEDDQAHEGKGGEFLPEDLGRDFGDSSRPRRDGSGHDRLQRVMLEREKVRFGPNGRIDLAAHRWKAGRIRLVPRLSVAENPRDGRST